jgi:hypothetical protein
MTIEQLCCVSVGVIVQAATFALGLVVGASLRRRESSPCRSEENVSHRLRPH